MAAADSQIPTCRWGIITTGLISSWFVTDLILPRAPNSPPAKANHVIQAIGTSSLQKGHDFVATHMTPNRGAHYTAPDPTIYDSYEAVYSDPSVDCIYVGTPHGFHKRDCLAAISAGKNILCEKAFTLNASEAEEVFAAAEAKGVYVAEAMWLRHRPIVADLKKLLYGPGEKVIGDVFRAKCDFHMSADIASLPASSRIKNVALGAGSLLDIGIYSLTWALLSLDPGCNVPSGSESTDSSYEPETPSIKANQSFIDGVEVSTSALLHYRSTGRQGIITCTLNAAGPRPTNGTNVFAVIEGTEGYIEVEGDAPSHPRAFTVYSKKMGDRKEGKRYEYGWVNGKEPQGFIFEADNAALDIMQKRKESQVMPWKETVRVMGLMDEIRRQGGTVYPCDK